MKQKYLAYLAIGAAVLAVTSCHEPEPTFDALAWVDPIIGTGAHYSSDAADLWGSEGLARKQKPLPTSKRGTMAGYDNAHDPGQCIPAVLVPYGMNFWVAQTEDTEQKGIAPYYYADEEIQGFRGSHWLVGSMTQDYGSFTLMPMGSTLITNPLARGSKFCHEQEITTPSYYGVELQDYGIWAEMTATSRAALFRFTYQTEGDVYLVVNPNSDEAQGRVLYDGESGQIQGSNPVHRIYQGWGEYAGFDGHFVVEVEKEILDGGVYAGDEILEGESYVENLPGVGAWVKFHVEAGETVYVRAASSFTGIEGAIGNLQTEMPDCDFDRVRQQLTDRWQQHLGCIEVAVSDAPSEEERRQLTSLYTALYHASFLPHEVSDHDGTYMSFGGQGEKRQKATGTGSYYDDYSMWDTYRAQHPLLCLIEPDKAGEMVQSLIDKYEDGGWLPIFPCWNSYTSEMIGDHCCSLVADAWFKGIRNFDIQKAYEALVQNAYALPASAADYEEGKGRRAMQSYLKYGYIPVQDPVNEAYHKQEQTSRTLEYAYDDYVLARLARALGHDSTAIDLEQRSLNYRNVFNPTLGWMDGRNEDGTFVGGDPFAFQKYICEGKPCHYTWYVPHDVQGLIELMGGESVFVSKLDSVFDQQLYWHGNEPCHQIAWLYDYTSEAWKTPQRIRQIMADEYGASADGLAGNDDAGQMSAWYVFAAMGLYPVCPGVPEYALAKPCFDRVTLHLQNGKTFTLRKEAFGTLDLATHYWLNGEELETPFLKHEDIMKGGTLIIR